MGSELSSNQSQDLSDVTSTSQRCGNRKEWKEEEGEDEDEDEDEEEEDDEDVKKKKKKEGSYVCKTLRRNFQTFIIILK